MCAEVLTVLSTSMASEAEPPVLILVPSSHSDCLSKAVTYQFEIIDQWLQVLPATVGNSRAAGQSASFDGKQQLPLQRRLP